MSKTVAFIDNYDEVELFLKTFSSCIDKETIFIVGDALAFEALKNKGIECKPLDDYRNRKEYEKAEHFAIELAEKWFVDNEGNDLTEFEGVSIGKCLKKETFDYFNYLLKAILDVSNILKYENPEKVLLAHDYSISNDFTGERDFCLHKKVFHFLKKDEKYDVYIGEAKIHGLSPKLKNILRHLSFERHVLAGKITYYCPAILNRFIKKLTVITIDRAKCLLSKNENNPDSVRALTLSATGLTYFGNDLIKSFLRKGNCYLYYLENENNCYFNSRILYIQPRKISYLVKNKRESKYLADLKLKFEKLIKCEKKDPRWVFMNLSLISFIERYLNEIIYRILPELIKFLQVAQDAIKMNIINIVLISERWTAKSIILTQIAKRNGLSVLHIPHGLEGGFKDGDKIVSNPICYIKQFPFYPTHEISSLKYYQEIQKGQGISQNKLFLTGIPRFGKLKIKTQKAYCNARKRLGFSQNEEIVLFAIRAIYKPFYDKYITSEQISTFTLSCLYDSFLKIFLNRKNSRAVFKLKMLDVSTEWLVNNFGSRNGINNISFFRNQLHDLLVASDAVVVTHSNIGIEALYNDTPVIVYNSPSNPSLLPLCYEGAAIEIKSPEELMPVLDRLRNDESFKEETLIKQRSFLQRNLPDDDLTSSERVSNVVIQLAKKN